MRRKSCKYVFLFNIVLFATIGVLVAVTYGGERNEETKTSVTSPLVFAESLSAPFCSSAKAAVLIDAKSGGVLFNKNAGKRLPMASTTKIMTALAVIENSHPDDIIEISEKAVGIEGSKIYLQSVHDLLYGLMLESGNDAAEALAIGVFGSVEKCLEYMNTRAKQMGLVDTNFETVHGLDSENHYTTAYELALITKNALENEFFRKIVSTQSYVTEGENVRYFSNNNRLLRLDKNIIGVKTGFTTPAGRCLVSAFECDGERYVAVTLNDPNDWQDHKEMLYFAAENFDGYEIADKESFRLRIGFSDYAPTESVYITTGKDTNFTLNYKFTIDKTGCVAEYSSDNMSLGSFALEKIISSGV